MTIIETIQRNLAFDTLKKIDPNTQKTMGEEAMIGNRAVAQAGIPAILIGIYNRIESNPDTDALQAEQGKILQNIFGKATNAVVGQIVEYAKVDDNHIVQTLEHIAAEAIRVVKEAIGNRMDESHVRKFVAKNKPDTYSYLPPAVNLGAILDNDNIDDQTGKMQGPVSSFMHKVEKTFNTSESNS